MFIYIGGTYLPPKRRIQLKRNKIEEENIKKVNEAITAIAQKGHLPFIPYTMIRGWENIDGVSQQSFRQICNIWLEKCEAVYFIKPPIDADSKFEQQFALKHSRPIYYDLNDIPEASSSSRLSSKAFKAYLVEYQQCMQNFRHIFATIWQAGALFAAISAGIIAFASSSNLGNTSSGISPLIQVLIPIPVIFWFLGIYRPMNRYCELDNDRLVQIEQILSQSVPGLDMRHFRGFSHHRKGEGFIKRMIKFRWLLRPRVVEIVTIFGIALILVEIYLLWSNYLSHWL